MASPIWVSTRPSDGRHHQANTSPTGLSTMRSVFPMGHRRVQSDQALPTSHPVKLYLKKGAPLVAAPVRILEDGNLAPRTEPGVEYLLHGFSAIPMKEEPDVLELRQVLSGSVKHQTQPRVSESPALPPQDETSHPHPLSMAQEQEEINELRLKTPEHHPEPVEMSGEVLLPPPGRPPGPGPGPSFAVSGIPKRSLPRSPHRQRSMDKDNQKIRNLRLEVWGLRDKIRGMRKDLRQKQLAKSAADNKYMQFARTHGLGMTYHNQDISQEQKTIIELFQDCESARDEYGPLEDDCNQLEDQLSMREFELQRLEDHVAKEQEMAQNSQAEASEPDYHSAASSNHSGSEFVQESHPLVSKYLSKMGEVDIWNERLDWRIEEKYLLEGEKETRQLASLDLPAASQAWLDNYENDQAELMAQLEEAEREGEELMQQCLSLGLVDEDGNPTDLEQQERHTFSDDEDVYAGAEKSDFVKFPLLLPHHGTKQLTFDESAPKQGDFSGSAGDHINQWLLHNLRSSAMDVGLLVRTYESEYGHIQNEDWEVDVLAFWYTDGARKDASKYHTGSSVGAIQAPRQDPHSDGSFAITKAGDQHYLEILIKSSSLRSFAESAPVFIESTGKHNSLLLATPDPPKLGGSIGPSTGGHSLLAFAAPASQRLEI